MELHSPATIKKLWNFLRLAFFMLRKGLISKRKLIMDLHLIMKRGKILGRALGNLLLPHHARRARQRGSRGGDHHIWEYEFSCSNSPNANFFAAGFKRRRISIFSCINASACDEHDEAARPATAVPRIEYSPQCVYDSNVLALGEQRSPLLSPFSPRGAGDEYGTEVDSKAEEFIRRFYEQLRAQNGIALLQYQEIEYQEMLARGA